MLGVACHAKMDVDPCSPKNCIHAKSTFLIVYGGRSCTALLSLDRRKMGCLFLYDGIAVFNGFDFEIDPSIPFTKITLNISANVYPNTSSQHGNNNTSHLGEANWHPRRANLHRANIPSTETTQLQIIFLQLHDQRRLRRQHAVHRRQEIIKLVLQPVFLRRIRNPALRPQLRLESYLDLVNNIARPREQPCGYDLSSLARPGGRLRRNPLRGRHD
jgi:hypothetical protein